MSSESIRECPESPPTEEKRYELGVLFIHGIGDQKRGQTLLAFGEPLCRWLEAWTEGSVQVSRAVLDPEDSATPAHVQISVTPWNWPHEVRSGTALLAESCWAESFPTPSFREVARWVLLALPWTLAAQFASRFRPAIGNEGGLLRHYPRFAVDTLASLITFLSGACVELLVAALLVLTVFPNKRVREILLRLQMRIAGMIGDSYALLNSPIRSSAILEKVRRDLAWLARQSDRVAIVAHSQGAAIAHRLIEMLEDEKRVREEREQREKRESAAKEPRGDLLDAVDLFFSFGSGLGKLRDVEAAVRSGGVTLLFGFVLMLCVLILVGFVPLALLAGPGQKVLVVFVYLMAVAGLLVIVLFLSTRSDTDRRALQLRCFRERDAAGGDGKSTPNMGTIRWVDRYATSDPVPSGPLFVGEAGRIDSQPVCNRASALFDHLTYWQNPDEFVRELVAELGPPLSLAFRREQLPLSEAIARRRWRVGWLAAFRILGFSSLLVLLWGLWNRFGPAGEAILKTARTIVTVGDHQPPELARALGATGVAGLVVLWQQVIFVAHKRWEARDFRRTAKRERLDEGGLPFLAFVSAGAVLPAVVFTLALLRFDLERVVNVLQIVWQARASIGFGSFMLPLFSAFAASLTWWLALRVDEKSSSSEFSLRGETFMQAWLATALGSFAIIVWLALTFPHAFTLLPPRASLLEQLLQAFWLIAPYVVAGGFVVLWSRTVGRWLAQWLTERSVYAPEPDERTVAPRSVEAMGAISLACGAASLALRWVAARFDLNVWMFAALVPLWFVTGLACLNATGREMETESRWHWRGTQRSLGSSLGAMGLLLAAIALMWNVVGGWGTR